MTVVVVGNGPSAMILSFVLSGNIPFYDPNTDHGPHPDCTLHHMLAGKYEGPDLAHSLIRAVHDSTIVSYIASGYNSFYSSSMLPVNLLLDTLISSDEVDFSSTADAKQTRVRWVYMPELAVDHRVIGVSSQPGGQWAQMSDADGPDELSLSYAEMVSLPGYSFSKYYQETYGVPLPEFTRPLRKDVAQFYAQYPKRVGIDHNFENSAIVTCVDRKPDDSLCVCFVRSNGESKSIACSQVVLASGVFEKPCENKDSSSSTPSSSFGQVSRLITSAGTSANTDNKLLQDNYTIVPPLSTPPCEEDDSSTLSSRRTAILVIGSGVSAAEAIDKCQHSSSVIYHIYKWDAKDKSKCPLRRYPEELYPEYAAVYRAMSQYSDKGFKSSLSSEYVGLRNSRVVDIAPDGVVDIELESGIVRSFKVNDIRVRTGRVGSLEFVSPKLLNWISDHDSDHGYEDSTEYLVNKKTLRQKVPEFENSLTVSENVYAVGSVTGDTLIRFMLGGCLSVTGSIMNVV